MAQLKYWVWLSAKQMSATKRTHALNHFGTLENLYYAEPEEYNHVEGLTKQDIIELSDKSFECAERIMEDCDRLNIKMLTLQDARYPDRLKNIYDPPTLLYYKGNMPAFDEEVAIAAIGTRKPSAYGSIVTERLAFDIARMGGYVVSGMAAGLDAAANYGALKAGKPTAAVLGGGADVIYPSENHALYEDIVTAGVIISEYPPGARPIAGHFPERNRIMSGLSLGVLVVEAGEHSGTLITANHASEQGRDIFAIPGAINVNTSVGTNALIRDGFAKLVTGAWDVLVEYAALYPHKIAQSGPPTFELPRSPKKPTGTAPQSLDIQAVEVRELNDTALSSISGDQRKIIDAVTEAPLYIDDIADRTGIPAQRVMSELTLLEIEELIKELPGKRYTGGDNLYKKR